MGWDVHGGPDAVLDGCVRYILREYYVCERQVTLSVCCVGIIGGVWCKMSEAMQLEAMLEMCSAEEVCLLCWVYVVQEL